MSNYGGVIGIQVCEIDVQIKKTKKFAEEKLEQVFIGLLGQEKIAHVLGANIHRALDEVLIKEDLKAFLLQKYMAEELTVSEVDIITRDLGKLPSSDLYESSKAIMKMVSDGFVFKREDRSKKDLYIQLIDYPELVISENNVTVTNHESMVADQVGGYVSKLERNI